MTAFSLPEGRNPAGDDAWIFVQLKSDGAALWQEELEVFSRSTVTAHCSPPPKAPIAV